MDEPFTVRNVSQKQIYQSFMGILRISPNEGEDDPTALLSTIDAQIKLTDSDGNVLPITFIPKSDGKNIEITTQSTDVFVSNNLISKSEIQTTNFQTKTIASELSYPNFSPKDKDKGQHAIISIQNKLNWKSTDDITDDISNKIIDYIPKLRNSSYLDFDDGNIKDEKVFDSISQTDVQLKSRILLQTFPKDTILYNAIPFHRFLAHEQNGNSTLSLIKNFKIDEELFTENPIFIRGYNWLHGQESSDEVIDFFNKPYLSEIKDNQYKIQHSLNSNSKDSNFNIVKNITDKSDTNVQIDEVRQRQHYHHMFSSIQGAREQNLYDRYIAAIYSNGGCSTPKLYAYNEKAFNQYGKSYKAGVHYHRWSYNGSSYEKNDDWDDIRLFGPWSGPSNGGHHTRSSGSYLMQLVRRSFSPTNDVMTGGLLCDLSIYKYPRGNQWAKYCLNKNFSMFDEFSPIKNLGRILTTSHSQLYNNENYGFYDYNGKWQTYKSCGNNYAKFKAKLNESEARIPISYRGEGQYAIRYSRRWKHGGEWNFGTHIRRGVGSYILQKPNNDNLNWRCYTSLPFMNIEYLGDPGKPQVLKRWEVMDGEPKKPSPQDTYPTHLNLIPFIKK